MTLQDQIRAEDSSPLSISAALGTGELVDRLPVGIYTCDTKGVVADYNLRAAELWGRHPVRGEPSNLYCGAWRLLDLKGDSLPVENSPVAEVLASGSPVRDRELIVERPDGSQIYILANADPVLGVNGQLSGAVNCFQDITELKLNQERLSEGGRRLRGLLRTLPAALYTTDAEGKITFFNDAAVELWGRAPALGEESWCGSLRIRRPDGSVVPHDQCSMAQSLRSGKPMREAEAIAERPDGTLRNFLAYPTPILGAKGELAGAVNMLIDITERKNADNRQRALVDELNHRVKNTLATVQSLAAQTLREAGSPDHVRENFENRLLALSKSHNQLAREGWESAEFLGLVADVLAPFIPEDAPRVTIQGPTVRVPPRAALTLAMVLHELATNAVKYGALSVAEGRLAVAWSVDGGQLSITWRESGGPKVAAPLRNGFGSRLITRGVQGELKGHAQLAFDPSGLTCDIRLPLPAAA